MAQTGILEVTVLLIYRLSFLMPVFTPATHNQRYPAATPCRPGDRTTKQRPQGRLGPLRDFPSLALSAPCVGYTHGAALGCLGAAVQGGEQTEEETFWRSMSCN